ncbi:MAG: hypothetical protein EA340_05185 [Nitriliruptor sp.]|nr:MAG: hypothetical protein EA340_05185 [Nitriliruptor sp.]
MADPTDPPAVGDDAAILSRYADHPPPPRWVYVVTGVVIGGAFASMGLVPWPLGLALLVLAAAVGLSLDRWLARRHGIPPLRKLLAPVRREPIALLGGVAAVVTMIVVIADRLDEPSMRAIFVLAGVVLAVGFGIGGPIVDRRTRDRARKLLR